MSEICVFGIELGRIIMLVLAVNLTAFQEQLYEKIKMVPVGTTRYASKGIFRHDSRLSRMPKETCFKRTFTEVEIYVGVLFPRWAGHVGPG